MGERMEGKEREEFGNYKWQTFGETDAIVEAISRTIIQRKLCPLESSVIHGTPDLKMMGIFSENRPQWFMTELACCSDSICVVPVAVEEQFLNEDRVSKLINLTNMTTICVSSFTFGAILNLKASSKIPSIKNIIHFDHPDDLQRTLSTQLGLQLYQFEDMVEEGIRTMDIQQQEPTKDTILMLGITSGTTGHPKCAMLTHLNFICGQASQKHFGFNYNSDDVYLSYVPLSHVYEQIMHIDALLFGFRIGYSSKHTKNLLNDIQALQPTIFGSFPNFFTKIYKKVLDEVEK